jgi:hypothetical protein
MMISSGGWLIVHRSISFFVDFIVSGRRLHRVVAAGARCFYTGLGYFNRMMARLESLLVNDNRPSRRGEVMPPSPLRSCPDCEKPVSLRAPSCPHCGCPITTESPQVANHEAGEPLHWTKLGSRICLAIIMLVGLSVGIALGAVAAGNNDPAGTAGAAAFCGTIGAIGSVWLEKKLIFTS